MLETLNNVTAPDDAPTAASTIDTPGQHSHAIVDVANAAIYWQVKIDRSMWWPTNGTYMAVGSRRLPVEGSIYGVRFWAAVATAQLPTGGRQAQVTVMMP